MAAPLDGRPLEAMSLSELNNLLRRREALAAQLEAELIALQDPSDIADRVTALESAVRLASSGDWSNPEARNAALASLVKDIEEHHGSMVHFSRQLYEPAVQPKVASMYEMGSGQHNLASVGFHPAHESSRGAQAPVAEKRTTPDHPDIGKRGAFAGVYQLVEDPWARGYDYAAQVPSYYPPPPCEAKRETSYHRAREDLQRFADQEDRVLNRVGALLPASAAEFMESLQDGRVAGHPLNSRGCGDVYVDLGRLNSATNVSKFEMARAGVPVYGVAPAVDLAWLQQHNIWKYNSARALMTPAGQREVEVARRELDEAGPVDQLGTYKMGVS